jgi:hypothetical protein
MILIVCSALFAKFSASSLAESFSCIAIYGRRSFQTPLRPAKMSEISEMHAGQEPPEPEPSRKDSQLLNRLWTIKNGDSFQRFIMIRFPAFCSINMSQNAILHLII